MISPCIHLLRKIHIEEFRLITLLMLFYFTRLKHQKLSFPFTFIIGLSNRTASFNTQFQQPCSAHTEGWFCTQSDITTLPMIAPRGNLLQSTPANSEGWTRICTLCSLFIIQPTPLLLLAWISTLWPMYFWGHFHVRFSMSLIPWAIRLAHGCLMDIAFMLLLIIIILFIFVPASVTETVGFNIQVRVLSDVR